VTVHLEPVTLDQASRVVAGDPDVVSAAPGWPHADTYDALRPFAEHGSPGDAGPFFVVETATGRVVGECGWYGPPGDDGTVEIGYGLAASCRGRGYGTEAVRLLLAWVDTQPGVRRVTAEVEPGNEASHRLLRRLGFVADGTRGRLVRYVRDVA
jgi:RimJ/RimL family protein N-acetyltransferase